jgi:multimeric flavodoxin WrbA
MKVVAINSSPKMDKGNTALVLEPFLEGMREAGAEVELFYTKKLKINPCQGESNCWFKTPGECFQQDDMQLLRPKLREADVWVLATPLYVDGITGPLKNLLDRLTPLAQPFIELRNGHCRHPERDGRQGGKLVLVSTCGFWEMDNFNPSLVYMTAVCKNLGREFGGAVLRPHASALRRMMEVGRPVGDVCEAAKVAGRQLIENGRMSPETLGIVSRELLPLERYIQVANQRAHEKLDALEKD